MGVQKHSAISWLPAVLKELLIFTVSVFWYNDIKIIKDHTNRHILYRHVCSSVALSTTPLER